MITTYLLCLRGACLDELARRLTVSTSLADLLEPGTSYRPSLYPPPSATAAEVECYRALADGYDQAQALRGDSRRAYRGEAAWWTPRPERAPRRKVQAPVKAGRARGQAFAALAQQQRRAQLQLAEVLS